jgi:cytochrome c biogenesis protein
VLAARVDVIGITLFAPWGKLRSVSAELCVLTHNFGGGRKESNRKPLHRLVSHEAAQRSELWSITCMSTDGRRWHMAFSVASATRKLWQTMSAVKTGVVLILLTMIFSAAGTVILQRPMTDPDEMQRAYSPQFLRMLDATGLSDVFHARWFVALLLLVSLSIIAASIQRFPNSWRFFSRPCKSADASFLKALPCFTKISIPAEEAGLMAAERAFLSLRYKPERIIRRNSCSLFVERHRISELAVYVVHASLLLIFLGGIVDALYGWRGFLMLNQGQTSSLVAMRGAANRKLPFAVRCEAAGEETYADGSPKRWWSKLTVLQDGHEVQRKEIAVNEPLVYRGLRFYQASYGSTGKLSQLTLTAAAANGSGASRDIHLALGETVALDSQTSLQLAEFIPDYVVVDGKAYSRSSSVVNPALHLILTSERPGAKTASLNYWLPEIPGLAENEQSPFQFEAKDLKIGYFTGLQVSYEPGQWAVWAGVILMGIGLTFVFYVVHSRFWAVPGRDNLGELALWVGGTANRNRDAFEQQFQRVVDDIKKELKGKVTPNPQERELAAVGK